MGLSTKRVFDRVALAIRLIPADDFGAAQGSRGGSYAFGSRLRIYLTVFLDDLAVKATVDVGIRFGGVVVIAAIRTDVAIEAVQALYPRAIRLFEAVDWVAVPYGVSSV